MHLDCVSSAHSGAAASASNRLPASPHIVQCSLSLLACLQAKAGATINSLRLAQALWENYLDVSCPSPVARAAWIAGAKALASAS